MDSWYITVAHFSGPTVDDREIVVKADNIYDALSQAEENSTPDEWIFSIQHEETL